MINYYDNALMYSNAELFSKSHVALMSCCFHKLPICY